MTEATLSAPNAFRLSIQDEGEDEAYARVSLSSAIGSVSSRVYSLDLPELLSRLVELQGRLSGMVEFESLEAGFALKFCVLKLGHIKVEARLSDVGRETDFLTICRIDQSYLPAFIKAGRTLRCCAVVGME